MQKPVDHLTGRGCPSCGVIKRTDFNRSTLEDFITKCCSVHEGRYVYNQSVYIDAITKIDINCAKHGIFQQRPANHLNGAGCPKCTHRISRPSSRWLDSLGVSLREIRIQLAGTKRGCLVDGFDDTTNTVFQFHGDYWHGNPNIFPQDRIHPVVKKTFGELYQRTVTLDERVRKNGYNLVVMWEHEWKIR
jgi:hypothetical protein